MSDDSTTPGAGPPGDERETGELPPVGESSERAMTAPTEGPQRPADDHDGDRRGDAVDAVADLLRRTPERAPPTVTDRTIARVRIESTALALVRTLGGAWLRVARALPDLIERPTPPRTSPLEDTGELPRPDDPSGRPSS